MRSLYLNKFGLMHKGLVKLVEDMGENRRENESEMNIYDISWMNKIK